MKCYTCGKKPKNKQICGSCREVLKIDLVDIILGLDPIYLSENNRYKHGKTSLLTAAQKEKAANLRSDGKTYKQIAEDMGLKKSTVYYTLNPEKRQRYYIPK